MTSPIPPEAVERYEEQGFLIVPSGASDADMDRLGSEILGLLSEDEARRADDVEYRKLSEHRQFAVGLHLRIPAVREYVQSDVFKAIGEALIGKEVDLHFTSTITKSARKNRSIDWHQDFAYDQEKYQPRIICWTSITASGPDNGGILVIPGSQRLGPVPHGKSELYERDLQALGVDSGKALALELKQGEILVIHPLLIHASSENRTSKPRIALMGMYQKPKPDYTEAELKGRIEILRA